MISPFTLFLFYCFDMWFCQDKGSVAFVVVKHRYGFSSKLQRMTVIADISSRSGEVGYANEAAQARLAACFLFLSYLICFFTKFFTSTHRRKNGRSQRDHPKPFENYW